LKREFLRIYVSIKYISAYEFVLLSPRINDPGFIRNKKQKKNKQKNKKILEISRGNYDASFCFSS